MRVAITGSSGLIGTALRTRLAQEGVAVTRIVRGTGNTRSDQAVAWWDPDTGALDRARLDAHDAVVHLAGADIAAKRWTRRRKQVIRDSRVLSTALLCKSLAGLARPPRVLITASGVGYYGQHPSDEPLDESSPEGSGFLADLVRDWEGATASAQAAGIRVVHTRFSIVLSAQGGALAKMLPPFRMGLGGRVGSGRQIMSWVAIDDLPAIVTHIINVRELAGPVNVASPHAVSNAEFTHTLGKALGRPTMFPLPGLAARLLFGEMADALLLGGARVIPRKLQESGFRFAYPRLEAALQHILGSPTSPPGA